MTRDGKPHPGFADGKMPRRTFALHKMTAIEFIPSDGDGLHASPFPSPREAAAVNLLQKALKFLRSWKDPYTVPSADPADNPRPVVVAIETFLASGRIPED